MAITRVTYGITTAPVNVIAYGATGDGVTDDTAAINAALAANKHVVVPVGTYLISDTIVVPASTRLEFLGGLGNSAVNAGGYLIKKSTMAAWGIKIGQGGEVTGGGLLGQSGNTGGGVWLQDNAATLANFWVKSIGGFGVKVGADSTAYRNSNCTKIDNVNVSYCTDHGIIVDHNYLSSAAPDANAGTISNCRSIANGGSGIYIGWAYWVTILNCNCEINTGYGLYLSGVDVNSYPACRWATIIGGDYNEGNIAGIVYDASYFSTFVNPDANNLPTTAPNGLQGSALRNYIGSHYSVLQGLTTENYPNTFGTIGGTPSVQLQTVGSNNVSDGAAITFYVDPASGTYRQQGRIKGYQLTTNVDGLDFAVNNAGVLTRIFQASTYYNGVTPAFDNTYNLGHPSERWGVVYATTGTINTSDERDKQDVKDLSDAEKQAALGIKGLIKSFRFKDAVAKKGDKARIHFGVMAQQVAEVFKTVGLNPDDYALFCYDEWEATEAILDEGGAVIEPAKEAGNRYGIRYDELLAFIIGAL